MPPRFIAVTVNYRCADEIAAALPTTLDRIVDAGGEFWVVDNASGDGSVETLRRALSASAHPDKTRCLPSPVNGGFGAGNNVAIRAILSEYPAGAGRPRPHVYVLNPDATPMPGAIETMADYLDAHPDVGIVGSALVDSDGSPTASMFQFPTAASQFDWAANFSPVSRMLHRSKITLPPLQAPGPVDWVSGASFMARAELWEQVGLFDEHFFLYWEEIQLCHRAWQGGFAVHGVPQAAVSHSGGLTTGMQTPGWRLPVYWHESRRHYFRSTGSGGPLWLLDGLVAFGLALRRVKDAILRRAGSNPHLLRDHLRQSFLNAGSARKTAE